jgi:hypothetical protein
MQRDKRALAGGLGGHLNIGPVPGNGTLDMLASEFIVECALSSSAQADRVQPVSHWQ